MKVLSLFDGMACGMLAMMAAGVEVESYDAYEIDKYAVKAATHNFPMIEQHGDVFKEDFTKYDGVDFLVGGSPCTYWSIAQTKNRETVASGIGWELFSQYVRALHEAKPKYFIYENNKSMSKEIRASIDEAFGFEAVCINSALVSAQNRQRLYWVGKRNADGTYSKVDVEQPQDRGILLKDVLDGAESWRDKSHTVDANYYKGGNYTSPNKQSGQRMMAAEPVCVALRGRYIGENVEVNQHFEARPDGKTNTLTSVEKDNRIAEPCCMRYERSEEAKQCRKAYEAHEVHHGYHELSELHPRTDGKSNTLSTVQKDNPICEPVQVGRMPRKDGIVTDSKQYRVYDVDGKAVTRCGQGGGLGAKTGLYALPVEEPMRVREATNAGEAQIEMGACVDMTQPNSKTRRGRSMDEKSNCLVTSPQYYQYCAKLCYAVPCEWDENGEPTKAVSCSDGKVYPVYKVENGQITIKDKQYPIKLVDGYYIIRKLTVRECMRLQTVPEWYDFSCVSNSQAYKMLGNGWTVEVIAHLISATKGGNE